MTASTKIKKKDFTEDEIILIADSIEKIKFNYEHYPLFSDEFLKNGKRVYFIVQNIPKMSNTSITILYNLLSNYGKLLFNIYIKHSIIK